MCEGRFRKVLKEGKLIPGKYNCRLIMVRYSMNGKKSDSLLEFGRRTTDADLGSVDRGRLLNRLAGKEGARREAGSDSVNEKVADQLSQCPVSVAK